jgi:hypothetical protein
MKWNGYPTGGEKNALGRAWDKTKKSWIPERAGAVGLQFA